MADPDAVLRAEDLRVERNGTTVLDGVSIAVRAGGRLLVRGPSGAGKTTLFQALGLLAPPTTGRIVVDGTDASDLSERRRARVRRDLVGIVFQEFRLIPDLTVRENAALPQEHAGDTDPDWLASLFDRLDIADLADTYPATLSGGEKQRVAIARALSNRPRVVLADEPTGQLDPETASRVLDVLLDLQDRTGTALVVVSHDRRIADRLDEVVRLERGRIVEA